MLPEPEDDHDRAMLGHIREQGWGAMHIPADEEGPGFGFTVGLYHTWKHPEILVMGLPLETAHELLTVAADRVRRGHRYQEGQNSDDFLVGYPCRLHLIPSGCYQAYLGYALWLYSGPDFPALQLLWPDREGRFPEDSGYALSDRQQMLSCP